MLKSLKPIGLVALGALAGILVSVNFSAVADRAQSAQLPLPVEDLRLFSEVYGKIKSDYVEAVEDKKLIKEAINGMLAGLDPHSAFLDQEAYKELQVSTQGKFGGLGIEVNLDENGALKVVSPIEDTPAFRAGIKSGDFIIKLDDTFTRGMSLNDAVKRMRGKPKTSIRLTVMRKGEDKPLVFNLVRDIIEVKSVRSKVIDTGYGVLRVAQFQEHTGEDVAKALKAMYKQNPNLKGIVLDLRNDPGGLLNSAVAVSAAFLPKDALVVYTDGRIENAKSKLYASPETYLRSPLSEDYIASLPPQVKTVPIVVLVNQGSASASEIVAGALQDHKRATVMGTQTFGKASVQSIVELPNKMAMKLTTARYYTPNGRSIQAKGIVPDMMVEDPATAAAEKEFGVREADLDRHLIGEEERKAAEGKANEANPDEAAKPDAKAKNDSAAASPGKAGEKSATQRPRVRRSEIDTAEDFQLAQALNLLKGQPVQTKAPDTPTAQAATQTQK